MKKAALLLLITSTFLYSCHKSSTSTPVDFKTMEKNVLADFVNVVAIPEMQMFQQNAANLRASVYMLDSVTTDSSLASAQQSWKSAIGAWEQSKAIYFGPILDHKYAAHLDTWPISPYRIDSALAADNNITLTEVDSLYPDYLRGFHPLEFILWGQQGRSVTDSFTLTKKVYMASLGNDIKWLSDSIYNAWTPAAYSFQQEVLQAGQSNTLYHRFANRQAIFLVIEGAMSQMTAQVNNNLFVPYHRMDSTYGQSRFAHYSLQNAIDNMQGVYNIYYCSFNGQTGNNLSSLIAAHNPTLDNKIKTQLSNAMNSFLMINGDYEFAIYNQPTQIQSSLNALTALQSTLDNELVPYIKTYVQD